MPNTIDLDVYRNEIDLDATPAEVSLDEWTSLIKPVLNHFGTDVPGDLSIPQMMKVLHGVLAQIDPYSLEPSIATKTEIIAAGNNRTRDIVDPMILPKVSDSYQTSYPASDQTAIWVGDITTIASDVIVNAANSEMLGCRLPNHACIDNAIHSAAGPRLRDDCSTIMNLQQSIEPVGEAKITRAYALPSRFVIHTVGPHLYPGMKPGNREKNELMQSYNSCLNLAAKIESIRTITFCAISTGVFAFPKNQAAKIALTSVSRWLESHSKRFDRVIFNLFSADDAKIYDEVLYDW